MTSMSKYQCKVSYQQRKVSPTMNQSQCKVSNKHASMFQCVFTGMVKFSVRFGIGMSESFKLRVLTTKSMSSVRFLVSQCQVSHQYK